MTSNIISHPSSRRIYDRVRAALEVANERDAADARAWLTDNAQLAQQTERRN